MNPKKYTIEVFINELFFIDLYTLDICGLSV